MISTLSRLSMPPWPAWNVPAERTLRAMLGELEGLPITGGESSVRLSAAGLDCGRWLAGFSPSGVSVERLQGLPERLAMAAADAQWFRSLWPRARQIGLGLEQDSSQVVAKVYLEFGLPAPDMHTRPPEQRQVALQIQSFKWRVDMPAHEKAPSRQTEYWRISGLDGPAMVHLLREGDKLSQAVRPAYSAVADALQAAMRAAPYWREPRLLTVREPGSERQGVGLRMYGSELKVSAALAPLKPLLDQWGLDLAQHPGLLAAWAQQELGWIHAGQDRQGQGFVIVYGALSRAQTRAVLAASGPAASWQQASVQESWT